MASTENVSEEVLTTLRKIMRAISLHSKKLVQQYGLTTPQILVLKEILKLGEITAGVLARNVNLSQATVTSILDRLEKRGHITRERSTVDKRKVIVRATRQGKEVFANAPKLLQEDFLSEFSKIEDWEQTLMLSALQRLAAMMNAKSLEAAPLLHGDDL